MSKESELSPCSFTKRGLSRVLQLSGWMKKNEFIKEWSIDKKDMFNFSIYEKEVDSEIT